jgi:nucleoside 2-deoxyribosyltransferase
MKKLYLAARYSRRVELKKYASQLKDLDYNITSRWLGGHDYEWTSQDSQIWQHFATIDLEDVDASDAVISFTHPRGTPVTGGGRHVEFGYGYARGKRMIVIGEKEHVFHHLPGVEIYSSLDDWLAREKK